MTTLTPAAGASATLSATVASARRLTGPAMPGSDLAPISGQTRMLDFTQTSNGVHVAQMSRVKCEIPASVTECQFVFANWQMRIVNNVITEVNCPNDVRVSCAIETVGGLVYRLTVGGETRWRISAGRQVTTDAAAVSITDTYFWLRTYVEVDSGQTWSGGRHCPAAVAGQNQVRYTTGAVDQTNGTGALSTTGSAASGSDYVYAPIAMLGKFAAGFTAPTVALYGDSITQGLQDSPDASSGYAQRAMLAANIPFLKLAQGSENGRDWVSSSVYLRRLAIASCADYALVNYGTNDWRSTGYGATQVMTDELLIWNVLRNQNLGVYACTLTPATTSTDSWVTVVNQTVHVEDASRTGYNDWLRDNAPVRDGAPVAVGTTGTNVLRSGDPAHPLGGWFEIADTVESARNSGKWKANYAFDGVHPNSTAHAAMAGALDTSVFSRTVTSARLTAA